MDGKTPFHTIFRETNRELLACSYEAVETKLVDDRGMHLLHYFVWSCKSTVADIRPFLSSDASYIFAKDHEGRSVLFFAAERGNFAVLDQLLNMPKRPDLSDTDVNGLSLMHYAVRSRRIQTIEILYHHGCSTQAVDKDKQTVLHHAAKKGNLEAIKQLVLLDSTSLLDRMDNRGRTPLDLAETTNKIDVVAYLKSIQPSLCYSMDDPGKSDCHSGLQEALKLHPSFTHRFHRAISSFTFWQILVILMIFAFGARSIISPTSCCSDLCL